MQTTSEFLDQLWFLVAVCSYNSRKFVTDILSRRRPETDLKKTFNIINFWKTLKKIVD